ncbi:hypothetical protein P7A58_15555, partial [Clostridium perfringens]|nr:hypothetical protein [Clostridium perfringens]
IVGGHSHTSLNPPERIGETWIVQAGSYTRQLGVLRLQVDGGRITGFDPALVDLLPDRLPRSPEAEVTALVEDYAHRIEGEFSRPAGTAVATLD